MGDNLIFISVNNPARIVGVEYRNRQASLFNQRFQGPSPLDHLTSRGFEPTETIPVIGLAMSNSEHILIGRGQIYFEPIKLFLQLTMQPSWRVDVVAAMHDGLEYAHVKITRTGAALSLEGRYKS